MTATKTELPHIPEHRRQAWAGLSAARARHRKLITAAGQNTLPLDAGLGLQVNGDDLVVERHLVKRPSWLDNYEDDDDFGRDTEDKPNCDVLQWIATGPRGAVTAHLYIDPWDLTDRTVYCGPGGSSHAPGFYILYRTLWNTPLSQRDWDDKVRFDAGQTPRYTYKGWGRPPFAGSGGVGINHSEITAFMDRGEASVLASLRDLYVRAIENARRAAPAAAGQQAFDAMVGVLRAGLAAGLAGQPPGVPFR